MDDRLFLSGNAPLFLIHFFGLNSGWMAGVTYSYVSGIAAIVLVLVVALELIPLLPTTIPPLSFPISPLSICMYIHVLPNTTVLR